MKKTIKNNPDIVAEGGFGATDMIKPDRNVIAVESKFQDIKRKNAETRKRKTQEMNHQTLIRENAKFELEAIEEELKHEKNRRNRGNLLTQRDQKEKEAQMAEAQRQSLRNEIDEMNRTEAFLGEEVKKHRKGQIIFTTIRNIVPR